MFLEIQENGCLSNWSAHTCCRHQASRETASQGGNGASCSAAQTVAAQTMAAHTITALPPKRNGPKEAGEEPARTSHGKVRIQPGCSLTLRSSNQACGAPERPACSRAPAAPLRCPQITPSSGLSAQGDAGQIAALPATADEIAAASASASCPPPGSPGPSFSLHLPLWKPAPRRPRPQQGLRILSETLARR